LLLVIAWRTSNYQVIQDGVDARDASRQTADIGTVVVGLHDAFETNAIFDPTDDERGKAKLGMSQQLPANTLFDLVRQLW
jgi:hypothetical protein